MMMFYRILSRCIELEKSRKGILKTLKSSSQGGLRAWSVERQTLDFMVYGLIPAACAASFILRKK